MTVDERLVENAVVEVKTVLKKEKEKTSNAMVILRIVLQTCLASPLLATNAGLLKIHVGSVIDRLLKGADEQQGTADDMITPATAEKIRRFLSDDNLEDFVDIVHMALSGNLVGASTETAQMATRCIFSCFAK